MSIAAVREYVALLWSEYQEASRQRKSEILSELQRNLKIHRKSAIRLMRAAKTPPRLRRGEGSGGRKIYSEAAKMELRRLWRETGYLGALRLKAALPEWLPHWTGDDCTESVRDELLGMSERTIERVLKADKADLKRRLNTGTKRAPSRHKTAVPLRNLERTPTEPGHCEVDCVAHCGESMSGTFAWTVTLTDIASGWTECETIWGKNGFAVKEALTKIEARLPFALLGLYFDNGCEFLNDDIVERFAKASRDRAVEVFRGRPYKKNDQPFVEQKNYTHVRALFGYERLDWKLAPTLMNRAYRGEWRLLQNHFYPQIRLVAKVREGSRIKRKRGRPMTPYAKLMAEASVSPEQKEALRQEHQPLNPFQLRQKLRKNLRDFRLYQDKDDVKLGKYAV